MAYIMYKGNVRNKISLLLIYILIYFGGGLESPISLGDCLALLEEAIDTTRITDARRCAK
jgi:hypothetical protein